MNGLNLVNFHNRMLIAGTAATLTIAGMLVGTYQAGIVNVATSQAPARVAQLVGSGGNRQPPDAGLRIESPDVRSLVAASDLIIVATFLDEQTVKTDIRLGGTEPARRTDTVRRFSVSEVLLGETPPTLDVTFANTLTMTNSGSVVLDEKPSPLAKGGRYLLFLRTGPDVNGTSMTGLASDPGLAEITPTGLKFVVSAALAQIHASAGVPTLPVDFQAASLDSVKVIAAARPTR